ncbi:hypothetical protein LMIY3S_04691 [Labrys miyagiensis]
MSQERLFLGGQGADVILIIGYGGTPLLDRHVAVA